MMKNSTMAMALAGLLAACSQADQPDDSATPAPTAAAEASPPQAGPAPAASPSASAAAPDRVTVNPGIWVEKSEVLDVSFDGASGGDAELAAARAAVVERARPERRRCRTRDEAIVPLPASRSQACDVQRYSVADGAVDVRVACPDPRGSGNVITSVTGKYDDASVTLVHDMRGPWPGGGTMQVRMRTTDKRIGACVGADD